MSTTTQQVFTIPLQNVPQSFNISLGPNDLIMTCKWNPSDEGGWVIGFEDQETGDEIVDNIPLVTGTDLLAGLEYLELGGQLVVYTNGDATAVPTLDNLGVESNLYFVVTSTS